MRTITLTLLVCIGAIAQERVAELREADTARVAMKQRRADEGLELLDPRGHDGARDAHLPSRLGEALRFGHPDERVYRGEAVHSGVMMAAVDGAAGWHRLHGPTHRRTRCTESEQRTFLHDRCMM